MSTVSPILTKVAAGSAITGQPGAQALGGSSSGVFTNGINGGNFWDLILSNLGSAEGMLKDLAGKADAKANALVDALNGAQGKDGKLAGGENPLTLLQIALSAQTIDSSGNVIVSAPETSATKLQKQLDVTNNIIDQLKSLLPESSEKEGIFSVILTKLQSKSDTLQASLTALENPVIAKDTPVEDIPFPLLITLGLNPAEISEVSESIKALEEKLGREITVEDLIAGVGDLIPPAPETAPLAMAALAPKSISKEQQNLIDSIDANSAPTDDLAAQLNALDVGGGENESFQQNVKPDPAADTQKQGKQDVSAFKDNLVNIFNGQKNQNGDMLFPAMMFNGDGESSSFQQFGASANALMTFGQSAQAANMIASGAHAGQLHPGTQMVAATLTKAGKGRDDSVMTLKLDPPELGNVSIKLQFGKDKTVKAVISAEKPETFLMLQRDAHALERALQSSGLETGKDALSFELHDHGSFAHNNDGDKGSDKSFGGGNGAAAQDAADGAIIQSSVMWQVDPSTGHVRYNIFA